MSKSYTKWKRLLSLILAFSMVMGGMSLTSYATGTIDDPVKSVSTAADDPSALHITKSVSDMNEDGTYDLTLEAYATGTSTVTTTHKPVDFILVLDVSGSMKDSLTTTTIKYVARKDQSYSWTDLRNKEYYIKDGDEYCRVYRLDVASLGVRDQAFYLYYTKNGVTYYLSGTGTTTVRPTEKIAYDTTIWTGILYKKTTKSTSNTKLALLQDAVNKFIDYVANDATAFDVEHRISLVKFAMGSSETIGNDFDSKNYNKSQIVKDFTVASTGSADLKTAVSAFTAAGATHVDYGLHHANTLLNKAKTDKPDSDKIIIVFTDGSPTSSNGFENEVANDAVKDGYKAKQNGATVYTVGAFSGDAAAAETFINVISSNYPNANGNCFSGTNHDLNTANAGKKASDSYSSLVTSDNGFDSIFTTIAENSIGTVAQADESSELVDKLSGYVDFAGTLEDTIVKTVKMTENGWSTTLADASKETKVSYDADEKLISVTGFDYISDENVVIDNVQGTKLVVTFKIKVDPTADWKEGANLVPTNAEDFALISKTSEDGTTTTNLINLTESPEIVVNAYSVTYSWTGLPEGQTAAVVPAKAVYLPGVDVKADTAFKKDDVVTVNGLKYEFSGWDKTEDFTMPSENVEIKGTWKEAVRDYTINYYQQGTATKGDLANYTLVSADTQKGTATAGSTVSAPEGYADKYADNNYVFEKADPKSITVDLDSAKNVINIFYAREATKATFVRNYTLTTISEDGKSTTADPVTVTETKDLQVGDTFAKTASDYTGYNGVSYTFVEDGSTAASITAEADENENVITFNYEATVDNRKPATVTVYHVYTLHDKKVVYGKYETEDVISEEIPVEGPEKKKATETYTATTLQPIEGYEGYAYSDGNNTITLVPGENKIVLYFEKDAEEPAKTNFTVKHYYTTTTVTVNENGVKSEEIETPDPTTVSVEKHVGESFTPIEVPNGFTSDPGNANKLLNPYTVDSDPEKNVVELYYSKRIEPAKADVTVNHYYYDITETTVPVTDENGVVIGTEVKETVAQNGDPVTATISGKYVGESYTVDKVAREGYTFMEKYGDYSSDPLSGRVAENGNTVNLYYFSTSKVDDRDGADISVKHSYVAHVKQVVNTFDESGALVSSKLDTVDKSEGEFVKNFTGLKTGDKFTAEKVTEKDGKTYGVVKGYEPKEIVLQNGTNTTVEVKYERSYNDYKETTYTVNYVYKTKKMVIGEDGKATYEWVTDNVEGHDAVKGTGYVGQYVTIDSGADSSYPFVDGQAPATQQQLRANGNEWTFTYYRVEDLSTVKVTVKHQYHTTVIGVNGEKTTTDEYNEKNDVVTTPYAGENASAAPAPNGFPEKENGGYDFTVTEGVDYTLNNDGSLSFTAGSDVTVVFDYYKTIDNSVSAEYTVKNVYEVYDWNGKLVDTETVDGRGGSSFATVSVSVEPTAKDQYEMVSAKFNGEPLEYENGYKITLEGGKNNEVVFTFKHTLERPDVSYTVIHEYYENGAFVASTEDVRTGKLDDVIKASDIEKQETYRDVKYKFSGSDVESITLESENGNYVITMTYVYDTYNYGLFYNGNGGADADGSTRLADAENVEDTEETAWTFAVDGGRFSRANYRFAGWATTSDGEAVYKEGDAITLSMKDQLVSENDPRTFGLELFAVWEYVGGNTRPRNPEPETPVEPEEPEDIEEPEVPLTEEPEITEEFEDVTEPEVPLAAAPEEFEDLLEDEVPLAAVPATGDRAIIWFVLSIMAALGLAVLTIEEKKARKF
ncbi:MAG: VWA domain-containing protein [Clostridia bacterium]|nr:VWA domain-containing protein [Clostridia bacterium]